MSTTTGTGKRVYGDEVLGSTVVIMFQVDDEPNETPFVGRIQKMEFARTADGEIEEILHYVVFDDGDRRWFNLEVEEEAGRLAWFNKNGPNPTSTQKKWSGSKPTREGVSVADSDDSDHTVIAIDDFDDDDYDDEDQYLDDDGTDEEDEEDEDGMYCPEEEDSDEEEDDSGAAASHVRKKRKPSFGKGKSVVTFHPEMEPDGWLKDMFEYLTIESSGPKISERKAKRVVGQIRMLASGQGIGYKSLGLRFCQGQRVDLFQDLDALIDWSKQLKDCGCLQYDVLEYPLRKLQQFKQYLESKSTFRGGDEYKQYLEGNATFSSSSVVGGDESFGDSYRESI